MVDRRRIAVVTTTRADYGLMRCIMTALRDDPRCELQIIASGTHLCPTFGSTIDEIKAEFEVAAEVDMLVDGNSNWAAAASAGLGILTFANTLRHLKPDLLLLLGDRFEILAVAQAAFIARIPIAHLHGGEVTQGAMDDSLRHAITKLSRIHLVSTAEHGQRVRQLGEDPKCVHVVGAPGLENLLRLIPEGRATFENRTGVTFGDPAILLTYHPATAVNEPIDETVREILAALEVFPSASILATGSNADPGGRRISEMLNAAATSFGGRLRIYTSLGHDNYMSAMRLSDIVIGNSSSGLIEAPSFGIPTINIGRRQDGRPRAPSVIDCTTERHAIRDAIRTAISPEMRKIAERGINPYASVGLEISGKVVELLIETPLDFLRMAKPFIDLKLDNRLRN